MNKHICTWFDLPAHDMPRAKAFYQAVLGVTFKDEVANDLQLAIFEAEPETVSGMLVKGEPYQPNPLGTVVYFNGGEDLSVPLARALAQGAQIVVPKTPIHEGECGYFALFIDSEGNRVGLYSQH